jgi:hypothetical protein
MSGYSVTVGFKMKDGRELVCSYSVKVTPGRYYGLPEYCYPDECDAGEPTYYINGEEVEKLPKGLDTIAEAMYEADDTDPRFSFAYDDSQDFEPPDFEGEWDD